MRAKKFLSFATIRTVAHAAFFFAVSFAGAQAQTKTNWVAFNDYRPSALTHPNVTVYDLRVAGNSGPLKNFATGADLPVRLDVTSQGTPDDFGANSSPDPGSPADKLFNGIVDVGNIGIPGVRHSVPSTITLTFKNLDPKKQYHFRGTASRGNNYTDRWTVFTITGASSFKDAHADGSANKNIFTQATFPKATLKDGQVVLNTGENRAGSLVAWDEIVPGANNSFSIVGAQYVGPTPFGNAAAGPYGYGLVAIFLAEIELTVAVRITQDPQSALVAVGQPATFALVAQSAGPANYQWQIASPGSSSFSNIPGATAASYTTPATTAADHGALFRCVVSVGADSVTSRAVALIVDETSATPGTEPEVAITSPANDAAFAVGADVTVTATASASAGKTIAKVEFFAGTIKLGETAAAPYSITVSSVPEGRFSITAKTTDSQGLAKTSEPVRILVGSPPDTLMLFAIDDKQVWSYDRSGQDLGAAWTARNFDDSQWLQGKALIALESDSTVEPIRTALPSLNNEAGNYVNTYYFRTHFDFPRNDVTGVKLFLRHVIDDGAVFYLNGVEAHRFGMASGALTAAATATDHENRYEGPIGISTASLVPGDNVFAVEVHQASATSSDVVFGAELTALVPNALLAGPIRITATMFQGGNLTLSWRGGGALQSADAVTGPWTDVANAMSPFAVAIGGGVKFYRLRP